MSFSAVMVVSDGADPFHLSAGSPSTGQPAYSEKALTRCGPSPPLMAATAHASLS
jgi:hypothetical protein